MVGKKEKDFLFLNYSGGQLTTRSVQRVCAMFQKFLKNERKAFIIYVNDVFDYFIIRKIKRIL